jgi:chromosome segregation ATPase
MCRRNRKMEVAVKSVAVQAGESTPAMIATPIAMHDSVLLGDFDTSFSKLMGTVTNAALHEYSILFGKSKEALKNTVSLELHNNTLRQNRILETKLKDQTDMLHKEYMDQIKIAKDEANEYHSRVENLERELASERETSEQLHRDLADVDKAKQELENERDTLQRELKEERTSSKKREEEQSKELMSTRKRLYDATNERNVLKEQYETLGKEMNKVQRAKDGFVNLFKILQDDTSTASTPTTRPSSKKKPKNLEEVMIK